MTTEKKQEINRILRNAKWFLWIGVGVIFFVPFLLTMHFFDSRFNFTDTGQIGDTIGGTTAPFLNLIGAFLVFYALRAQVRANELVQEQIDRDNATKELDQESQNLNQLYSYLNESITSFKFTSLPPELLRNVEVELVERSCIGGDGFFKLLHQIRCHFHGDQSELEDNQSVSELTSILTVMDLLLTKLKNTKVKNKEILQTLVKHQFDYKIMTRIRNESIDDLKVEFCEVCNCNHGLPESLHTLVGKIRSSF